MRALLIAVAPVVGVIFAVGGVAAYTGRWRSWVERSRRPWRDGVGFAGVYLGVAAIVIPGALALDRVASPWAPGAWALGDVALLLGLVVTVVMPPFLAPRWFRSQEGRRATGTTKRDLGYATVRLPNNWTVSDGADGGLDLAYSGPADVATPTITLRSTLEAVTLDSLQARTERAVAFAGGEIVSTESSRPGGEPARRVTSFGTSHDVPTLTTTWLWARPDRSVTLEAASPTYQAASTKRAVDEIAERMTLS